MSSNLSQRRVTRLAPSPTGALHLGNARTFLVNWALARRHGWRIVLRIEDLDTPRIKSGADRQAIEDLSWLGVNWDDGPFYQTRDLTPYTAALSALRQRNLLYACTCSRKEIVTALSAPHAEDHELRYPGTCRSRTDAPPADSQVAWRLIVPDESIDFDDQFHGRQSVNVQQQVGDFVVATKAGLPAYQLAVVVDDARQGVTDVVRGDDLLASTGRQLWLYRLLGLVVDGAPLPTYRHLPLVIGEDGRRLAKRHGDTRLAWYRQNGVEPARIIGLLAYWCGLGDQRRPMGADEFLERFSLDRLPRRAVTFTPRDHVWLLGENDIP